MRRVIMVACSLLPLSIGSLAVAESPRVMPASLEVPAAAEFDISTDWSAQLGSITDGSDLNCSRGNKTFDKASDVVAEVLANLSTVFTTQLNFTCKPVLAIADKTITMSGTISSSELGLVDGVYTLSCNLRSNISVVASVAIGKTANGTNGYAKVRVTSATLLPVACAFSGSGSVDGQESTVRGTIEGFAKIGDAATSTCEVGDTGCIPFSVTDAKVTITEATGALSGYVGGGTYSYEDTFNLASITTPVNLFKKVAGVSSVRATAVSAPGTMNVTFKAGNGAVVILRPAPSHPLVGAVVTPSTPVVIAAPVGSSCKLRFVSGLKLWETITPVTIAANGRAQFTLSRTDLTTKVASKLKVKLSARPTVSAKVTCTKGDDIFTATEKLKLAL